MLPVVPVVELNRPSNDVFPPPTPTAGTLPFCLPVLEPASLVPGWPIAGDVVCKLAELSSATRDVFWPPIPTTGTFPACLPIPDDAAAPAVEEELVMIDGAVVTVARLGRWKAMGSMEAAM